MDSAPKKPRATYADVRNAPEHKIAEILDGDLHLSRPGGPATRVAMTLSNELYAPFDSGRGGPGGWLILGEPELHIGDDVVVPDVAAWKLERLPVVPEAAYFTVIPDWVCEVLSPSTYKFDRIEKLPFYASVGVNWAWIIDPRIRTLEALRLYDRKWLNIATLKGDERGRIEPFDAIELDLAKLWSRLPLPSRASEEGLGYWDTY